ncbi:hypothetical protein SSX86_029146 [Deinandra increscens subsp. villosa]|uniref:GAGA-binding transcriptional activator n=1 Tax=Deinandra increscens subsp. villosa TaxID=3103831 RepID=A0AAP0CE96_9ASTR
MVFDRIKDQDRISYRRQASRRNTKSEYKEYRWSIRVNNQRDTKGSSPFSHTSAGVYSTPAPPNLHFSSVKCRYQTQAATNKLPETLQYLSRFFAVAPSLCLRNGRIKHDILVLPFSGGMDRNHFTIKTFMAIMAERDAAIQERNLALDERKRAFAERDMAMLQRDAALAERNSAMQERDEAITTLRFRGNFMNKNIIPTTSEVPENIQNHESKHGYTDEETHHMFEIPEDYQLLLENTKPRKVTKKTKPQSPRAGSKRVNVVNIKRDDEECSGDAQLEAWKDELGLNQVSFDEAAMPVPVCSCTGVPQPCYRWGNGGWQSACCTTTMSVYPLPLVTNKRYSRVGGRKMSGGAFTKLLSRLASEGYDLSGPLDLKEHWAKHGTNRYSTVK